MRLYSTSATFIRPNNNIAYAAGQLVANDTTAANVVPMSFAIPSDGFLLSSVKFNITVGTNPNTQWQLYLFQFPPTVNNGDGGNFSPVKDYGYLGNVYLDTANYGVHLGTDYSVISFVDPNVVSIFKDTTPGVNGPTNLIYGLLSTATFSPWNNPGNNSSITVTLRGID